MKILIATGIYPPDIGGPATYTALLEAELLRRGIAVSVLPFSAVRRLPRVIRHLVYLARCFLLAGRATIVYAQDPVSVGLPALCASRLAGKPFIIRVAGDYAWEQAVQRFGVSDGIDEFQIKKYGWKTEILRSIQKFVVRRAHAVIVPSGYFKKLVGGWMSRPENIEAIYNGIQLGKLTAENQEPKTKTIISAGRLVPW